VPAGQQLAQLGSKPTFAASDLSDSALVDSGSMDRTDLRTMAATLVAAAVVTACSGRPTAVGEPSPPAPPGAVSSSPSVEAHPPVEEERSDAEQVRDVIEGIVVTVSVKERTMTLERPERGVRLVAMEPRAELLHADGTRADLAEHVATGSAIRASGRRGASPEILRADEIVLLGDE
jgi:hypothetical protein